MYLRWDPVTPQSAINGILRGYMIQYNSTNGQVLELTVCNDTLNVTLREMIRHERYTIRICAFTSKGCGLFSSPIYVTTDEDCKSAVINHNVYPSPLFYTRVTYDYS